uniref:Uncharacterized protein n=1 Tax=Quercus lobata TaxID=97700 RepID=A0A7N2KPB6_QUELO
MIRRLATPLESCKSHPGYHLIAEMHLPYFLLSYYTDDMELDDAVHMAILMLKEGDSPVHFCAVEFLLFCNLQENFLRITKILTVVGNLYGVVFCMGYQCSDQLLQFKLNNVVLELEQQTEMKVKLHLCFYYFGITSTDKKFRFERKISSINIGIGIIGTNKKFNFKIFGRTCLHHHSPYGMLLLCFEVYSLKLKVQYWCLGSSESLYSLAFSLEKNLAFSVNWIYLYSCWLKDKVQLCVEQEVISQLASNTELSFAWVTNVQISNCSSGYVYFQFATCGGFKACSTKGLHFPLVNLSTCLVSIDVFFVQDTGILLDLAAWRCLNFHLLPNVSPLSSSLAQLPPNAVTSIIDGLRRLYIEKPQPLEVGFEGQISSINIGIGIIGTNKKFCYTDDMDLEDAVHAAILMRKEGRMVILLLNPWSFGTIFNWKDKFYKHLLKCNYPVEDIECSDIAGVIVELNILSASNAL